MGTKVAARDARIFAKARAALKTLMSAGAQGSTGTALFGDDWHGRWGYTFIQRLVLRRVVTERGYGESVTGRKPKLYAAAPELVSLVDDDNWLSSMLWPSGAPHEIPFSEMPRDEEPPLPTPHDDVQAIGANETLEAVLKLSAATLENVAHIREQLSALTRDVAELKKVWTS